MRLSSLELINLTLVFINNIYSDKSKLFEELYLNSTDRALIICVRGALFAVGHNWPHSCLLVVFLRKNTHLRLLQI